MILHIFIFMRLFILGILLATLVVGQENNLIADVQANQSCTEDCCKSLTNRVPMTYTFYQNSGRLVGGQGEYAINTKGYSGQGEGYLNPDLQCKSNIGPLPASTYKITWCKNIMHETVQRPCSFYLDPQKPSEICGRSDFFIHGCGCCTPGDSQEPPTAGCSAGCVVIKYEERIKLRIGDILIVQHYDPKT